VLFSVGEFFSAISVFFVVKFLCQAIQQRDLKLPPTSANCLASLLQCLPSK
jgi:hypothetical protein